MVAENSELSDYSAPGTARQSGRALLRHAIRTRDRLPVLLKTFAGSQPHPKDIARLDNEYRITSQLDSPTVVRPIALEMKEGAATLVLEDFGGEPLEAFLERPMSVELFLEVAICIARALAEIHRRGVVHKDIKPENVLLNSTTREVKITEFGIATLLPRELPLAMRPSLIEGTLAYMAPEQTGRMNRPVDSRSDLYSLGVVFFRMLTGRTPFEASDPLEWIHCHVARPPPSPCSVVPGLPIALSELVLKLLAKDPELRYQSADGLTRDLERCQREWISRRCIAPFVLGEHDAFDRFRIPRTLYGREPELATLRGALHRVQATGQAEVVLVRGGAGVGKSSLVRELHKQVIEERGIYLEGKFEQLRTVPYGAILRAVLEVVLDVLAEDPVQRAHWQAEFIKALGANAKLIVDVIPQLALVIGEPPDVPELARGDAEKRFRRVFRDFIGVFARPERPLVVFLDDLHWVDGSSLALIEEVVGHSETRNLLLIGAYRDNEVSPNHVLTAAQHRLQESGKRFDVISLQPLGAMEIGALVADTIRVDAGRTRELAGILHQKTGGNPFFVIQVLKALRRENLLWFDEGRLEWSWDLSRITRLSYTNNVVDLLLRKLVELPMATQELLQIAASVGNRHSLEMLALASEESEITVLCNLWSAVREGLIVLTQDSYAFVHDRMQQAAYAQIPVAQRRSMHLRIGRRMRDHTPPATRDERLFDIASQLNLGASLLASRDERRSVAELDLLAGRKARSASAFGSALDYFSAGGALLDEGDWDDCYDLKYALELDRAECEWLTGKPERARDRLENVLRRARTRLERGAAAELLVAVHLTLGTIGKDIEVALWALRSLGIDVSPHPRWDDVVAEFEMVERRLAAVGSIEDLVDLPPMTDPESRLAMRLLSILFGPALWSDSNLFAYHLCKMVRLSLEKGNTGASVREVRLVWRSRGPGLSSLRRCVSMGQSWVCVDGSCAPGHEVEGGVLHGDHLHLDSIARHRDRACACGRARRPRHGRHPGCELVPYARRFVPSPSRRFARGRRAGSGDLSGDRS